MPLRVIRITDRNVHFVGVAQLAPLGQCDGVLDGAGLVPAVGGWHADAPLAVQVLAGEERARRGTLCAPRVQLQVQA